MADEVSVPVVDAAPIETPPVVEVPPSKKKYSYKADGQEVNEELDDNEVASRLSMAKVANKRLQEASATKKEIEQFKKALQENPMSILSDDKIMGTKKFRDIAEQFLLKQIEEESMTPEERDMADRNRRLSEYERKEKEIKDKEEAEHASRLESQYAAQYEKTIVESLNSSGLPKTPFTVKRMASLMQKSLEHGLDLDPIQLATLVKEDYQAELAANISGSSAEQLIAMFGEEMVNKIRKHDLEKFRANKTTPVVNAKPSISNTPPPNKMTPREYTQFLKNKFKK